MALTSRPQEQSLYNAVDQAWRVVQQIKTDMSITTITIGRKSKAGGGGVSGTKGL